MTDESTNRIEVLASETSPGSPAGLRAPVDPAAAEMRATMLRMVSAPARKAEVVEQLRAIRMSSAEAARLAAVVAEQLRTASIGREAARPRAHRCWSRSGPQPGCSAWAETSCGGFWRRACFVLCRFQAACASRELKSTAPCARDLSSDRVGRRYRPASCSARSDPGRRSEADETGLYGAPIAGDVRAVALSRGATVAANCPGRNLHS